MNRARLRTAVTLFYVGTLSTALFASACTASGPGAEPDAPDDSPDSPGDGPDTPDDTPEPPHDDPGSPGDVSVAEELGLTQYSGRITPEVHSEDGAVTTYRFDRSEGPVCMRGGDFFTGVRDNGADDLVIYLQFGGVCWSEFCLANTKAQPGIPDVDILSSGISGNPVASWNHVFAPYCDGSLFSGDAEYDDNINDRGARYHYGLANLTAALEVARLRFPAPRRVLLAGSSGGGYGLLIAGFLTRHYYPTAELVLLADSGIGLARGNDPAYLQGLLDEFNLNRFIPADCPDCTAGGHLTGMMGYLLERDPDVRVGLFSSWYDSTLAKVYLDIPSAQFSEALEQQSARLHADHPERFRRFIIDGVDHAMLPGNAALGTDWSAMEVPPDSWIDLLSVRLGSLQDTEIGGLTATAWLAAMIDNDTDVWVDIEQERGPDPDAQ